MPLAERRMRHERMLGALREHDLHQWSESFTAALRAAGRRQRLARNDDPGGVYVTPRPLNG